MRELAWLLRTHSRQTLLGLLTLMAWAVGVGDAMGAPQNRNPASGRAPQPTANSNQNNRGAALPRRGSNLQAAPLPNRTARSTTASPGPSARTSTAAPSANFPYTVTTINPRTPIRSSPSDDGYATVNVGPQTELQVWRHDPNGWLAIRPPDGSFSLVDAKHLKATNDPDVFVVSTDRAQTWVGTQIDEDHVPISQVRLKLNEQVAVISSLIIEEETGAQTWYQIEPPAGEFRWVHQDDLRSGGRVYPSPSAGEIANRPKPPANAPMSGYMPPLSNSANAAPGRTAVDLPPLELDPGFGQPSQSAGGQPAGDAPWRAAQQTAPVLGYAEPQPGQVNGSGFNAHPASHDATLGSPATNGAFVQPVDQQSAANPSRQMTPGDAWDAAVNQLRQDPVANAVANANPQTVRQPSPAQPPLNGSAPLSNSVPLSSSPPLNAATADPQWATLDWNQKLAWVQAQLNQQSVQPTQQWNLLPLLEQCRALWYAAPTTVQQEAAATLGRRIEEMLQFQYSRGNANDLSAQTPPAMTSDPWAGQRWASAGSFVGSAAPPASSNPNSNPVGSGAFNSGTNLGNPGTILGNPGTNVGPNPGAGGTPENRFPATGPAGPGTAPSTNVAYDAVGYLKELVVARGQRSNEYVLQDDNGRSICHLSAQPGVNLNNFLDQKVGVIGIMGINGKLNLPHVSVERIYRVQ